MNIKKIKLATLAFLISETLNSAQCMNTILDNISRFITEAKIHKQTRGVVMVGGMKFRPVERGTGINGDCFYNAVGISREEIYNRVIDTLDNIETLQPYEQASFVDCICKICNISELDNGQDAKLFAPEFDMPRAAKLIAWSIHTKMFNPSLDDLLRFADFIRSIPHNISTPHELQKIAKAIDEFNKNRESFKQVCSDALKIADDIYDRFVSHTFRRDQQIVSSFNVQNATAEFGRHPIRFRRYYKFHTRNDSR